MNGTIRDYCEHDVLKRNELISTQIGTSVFSSLLSFVTFLHVFLDMDLNPLCCKGRGNYIATSNNTKLVHWPLMGGLLHLVQRGGAWAGCGPTQSRPRCTKSIPFHLLITEGPEGH